MLVGVKIKQPDERLDYDFIYDDWFGTSGDTIDSVEVNVVGTGTLDVELAISEPTVQKIWVQGGSAGEVYKIEVTITSVAGRVKQDELEIRIQEY